VSLPWYWVIEYEHLEYPVTAEAICGGITHYLVQIIMGSELVKV
jgi:hypothetical protein